MANLTRTAIRTATVAALLNQTDAADRVHKSRKAVVDAVDGEGVEIAGVFPLINVYTLQQTDDPRNSGGTAFGRTVDIGIECHVQGNDEDGADDAIDALTAQVESALLCSPEWLDNFERVSAVKTLIRMDAKSARFRLAALLTVSVVHHVEFHAPDGTDTLDTIGGAVQIPIGADLPILVDLT